MNINIDPHKYDSIYDMPHHISDKRLPMSMMNRAAQFSPFAALRGHDEDVEEMSRINTERVLNEVDKEEIDLL